MAPTRHGMGVKINESISHNELVSTTPQCISITIIIYRYSYFVYKRPIFDLQRLRALSTPVVRKLVVVEYPWPRGKGASSPSIDHVIV